MVAFGGELQASNFGQIRAIFSHLHSRGCRHFVVDITALEPMSRPLHRKLSALLGITQAATSRLQRDCALRLTADYPVARPQLGHGGFLLRAG